MIKYIVIFFCATQAHASTKALNAWKEVWTKKNKLQALRDFKNQYGLFLETDVKGKEAVMISEGACGDTFVSLVKNTKKVTDRVWEVDKKGNVLNLWHTGIEKPRSVKGTKLYRTIWLYENPAEFSAQARTAETRAHEFLIEIGADGNFEILALDNEPATTFETVTCQKHIRVESDYKYCVKDPKSGRLFVFEGPCT